MDVSWEHVAVVMSWEKLHSAMQNYKKEMNTAYFL